MSSDIDIDTVEPGPAPFTKLRHQPAYQAVSQRIREQILNGNLKAGDLLPTETDLANQFGVTRSTVREAIRLLEHSGLLGRADRKRLVVARPSKESASRSLSTAMLMHSVTFRELWEISMGLEPLAATLACASRTEEDLARLNANLERTAAAGRQCEELLEAEIEFHDLVAQATGNRALLMAREPLNQLFYPAYRPVIEALDPLHRILESHRRIAEAIADRDPEVAAEWARKHMQDFRRGLKMARIDFEAPVSIDSA